MIHRDKVIILICCCLQLFASEKRVKKRSALEKPSGVAPNIIDGVRVPINLFPHVALITFKNKTHCEGSVISNRVVLTAAHCFSDLRAPAYAVYLGSSTVNMGVQYKVCKIVQHKRYDRKRNSDHDVALILLRSQIKFSTTVQTIQIAQSKKWRVKGNYYAIAGFRTSQGTGSSQNLISTRVILLDSNKCVSGGNSVHTAKKHQFCMSSSKVSRDYSGDSGSGVIGKNGILVGIVSVGGRACCGSNTRTFMCTDVAYFRKWIKKEIKALELQHVSEVCPLKMYKDYVGKRWWVGADKYH